MKKSSIYLQTAVILATGAGAVLCIDAGTSAHATLSGKVWGRLTDASGTAAARDGNIKIEVGRNLL